MEAVHSETLTLRHQQLMHFATHGWDEDEEWRDASVISTATARADRRAVAGSRAAHRGAHR